MSISVYRIIGDIIIEQLELDKEVTVVKNIRKIHLVDLPHLPSIGDTLSIECKNYEVIQIYYDSGIDTMIVQVVEPIDIIKIYKDEIPIK